MTTDTPDKPRARRRRELPPEVHIEPLAVSPEIAAAMLAQIGQTLLDDLTNSGRLRAVRISPRRIAYRVADLRRFIDEAPVVVPGVSS